MFNGLHYNSISTVLKDTFGRRIVKLSVDGHFTCPNRDGKTGLGGCSFCSSLGSGEFTANAAEPLSITAQLQSQAEHLSSKWDDDCRYIAYFQAFTNTYAPKEKLRALYDEALSFPGVVGLAIATRPDCLPDEVLDLLDEYNKTTYLWLELGLQTSNEKTAKDFGRGYENAVFEKAMHELSTRGIKTVVHMILGLPGDTKADMLKTASYINSFNPFGLKIHMLNILKDSRLGKLYLKEANNPSSQAVALLSKEEYVNLVCDIIELMSPSVTIHRLTGDGAAQNLLAPLWVKNKHAVLNDIQKEFSRRGSWQGQKLL